MPIGLICITPAGPVAWSPVVGAACAAARSAIRRRGFTIRDAWSCTVHIRRNRNALRAGRVPPVPAASATWLAAGCSAWLAAEQVAATVGWRTAGLVPPTGLRLALGVWPTGGRAGASRAPARWATPEPTGG